MGHEKLETDVSGSSIIASSFIPHLCSFPLIFDVPCPSLLLKLSSGAGTRSAVQSDGSHLHLVAWAPNAVVSHVAAMFPRSDLLPVIVLLKHLVNPEKVHSTPGLCTWPDTFWHLSQKPLGGQELGTK